LINRIEPLTAALIGGHTDKDGYRTEWINDREQSDKYFDVFGIIKHAVYSLKSRAENPGPNLSIEALPQNATRQDCLCCSPSLQYAQFDRPDSISGGTGYSAGIA
jgi:hypothetical protein